MSTVVELVQAIADRDEAIANREELVTDIENLFLVATTDEDADGFIAAYHFKTGALHRLLAKDRQPLRSQMRGVQAASVSVEHEALNRIAESVPCRGDKGGDCAYCGGVAAMDDLDKHEDDCPWKIARIAISAGSK